MERPPVAVQLYGNGFAVGDAKAITDNEVVTWNVPVTNILGDTMEYTVKEVAVPENYFATYTRVENEFTITNTSSEAGTVGITLNWVDNDNASITRPDIVTVSLQRNDGELFTRNFAVDKVNDTQELSFTGMPRYNPVTGEEYSYVLSINSIPEYSSVVDQETKTITNSLKGLASVSMNKIWRSDLNENSGYEATFELMQNGNSMSPEKRITLTGNVQNGFSAEYIFDNLEKYDSDGVAYKYDIEEIAPADDDGFTREKTSGSIGYDYVFINTKAYELAEGSFSIKKVDFKTKAPLGGVKFELLDFFTKNVVRENLVSNADGIILIEDLVEGDYLLREVEALPNYVNLEAYFSVVVDHDGNVTIDGTHASTDEPFEIVNVSKNHHLVLQKTDLERKVLPGAEFALFDEDESFVGDYITDENGLIVLENLEIGKYKIKETTPPTGYNIIGDGEYSFEYTDNNIIQIHVANTAQAPTTTSVKVSKIWEGLEGPAPNIQIRLLANGVEADRVILQRHNHLRLYFLDYSVPQV